MDTTIVNKFCSKFNCNIEYCCNWDAPGNSQEIQSVEIDGITGAIHMRGSYRFLTLRKKGEMYGTVYKVEMQKENI